LPSRFCPAEKRGRGRKIAVGKKSGKEKKPLDPLPSLEERKGGSDFLRSWGGKKGGKFFFPFKRSWVDP